MILECTSGHQTTCLTAEMQYCNKDAHRPLPVEQDALPTQVPIRGSKCTPDIVVGLGANPRREWTVLHQLKGILDIGHTPSEGDYDHIPQPLATAQPAVVWSEVSRTRYQLRPCVSPRRELGLPAGKAVRATTAK
jgi:hypothetical protein